MLDTSSEESQEERQPLLSSSRFRGGFVTEILYLAEKALPIAISYTLQNSLQTLSIFVVARLGAAELNAASQGYMFAQATIWVLAIGGTSAIDTLGSSTFGSAQDLARLEQLGQASAEDVKRRKEEVGTVLQRALLILGVLLIPFVFLWWWATPVFIALGQSEELARDVQRMLRVLLVGAPGYVAFESVKKFVQVQGIVQAPTKVLAIMSPICFILNYILVRQTPLGFLGAPLATSISYWLALALLCRYCKYVEGGECWGGWSKACLDGWPTFLKLSLPGIAMVGSETWAFEIVGLAAGHLGDLALGAQSVIGTADQIICTLPLGIGVATSNRVGALLGGRQPRQARTSAFAGVSLATLVGSTLFVIILASRNKFGYLFSNEPDVVALVATVLPFVAAFQVFDGWASTSSGVLRGMGKQRIGASVNLLSYYALALPAGIWLAFNTYLGLTGLWIGNATALGLVGVIEFTLISWTDWEKEVTKARERTEGK